MKSRYVKLLSMFSVICVVLTISLLLYSTQAQQPKPGKERVMEVEIGADAEATSAAATRYWKLKGNSGTTPGINFLGTTDSKDLLIKTNNNEAMRINTAGNVGIGTTSPTALLHLASTAPIDLLRIDDNIPGDTTPIVIDHEGKIGIRKANPEAQLDVDGNIFVSDNLTIGTTATGPGMEDLVLHKDKPGGFTQIVSRNTNSSGYAELVVNCPSQNTGSAGALMARFGGDWTGSSDAGNPLAGNTLFAAGGVHTSFIFNPGIDYRFEIGTAEVMRIAQNGNVGIGTTNPQGKLDVNGSIYQRGGLLHADYVFEPGYKLETIEEHAAFMRQHQHLSAIPKATVDAEGREILELGAHRRGIVEELEKAHIYIDQLHQRIESQQKAIENQAAELTEMKAKMATFESALQKLEASAAWTNVNGTITQTQAK